MSFIRKIKFHFLLSHINMGLSRGTLTCAARKPEEDNPLSWEFSAFSENGEDGITDYLLKKIISPNRYFVEIGSGNGLHNNTAYLAIALKYSGLMIDGNSIHIRRAQLIYSHLNGAVTCLHTFINTRADIKNILSHCAFNQPDFFSLDIDGIDYHVMKMLFEEKFFPKIICVEYNSSFGPEKSLTIPYAENFDRMKSHASGLYYGISVSGWKNFLAKHNYQFVTVCRNGVNAFFIHRNAFDETFLQKIKDKGLAYAEGYTVRHRFKCDWEKQYKIIEKMQFEEV